MTKRAILVTGGSSQSLFFSTSDYRANRSARTPKKGGEASTSTQQPDISRLSKNLREEVLTVLFRAEGSLWMETKECPSTKSLRREKSGPLRLQGASAEIAGIVAGGYVEDDFGAMNEADGDGTGFRAEGSLWMDTN
jgi:hypothetical protein